jgi:Lon protease-like protein
MTTFEVPLFPLSAVLFPHLLLPLYIFEERYKLMVNKCLADSAPFGVVLIKLGKEVGGPAVPHTVGTLARILHSQRESDGKMHISALGETRFKLLDWWRSEPYLTGRAMLWEDAMGEEARVAILDNEARPLLRACLTLQMKLASQPFSPEEVELPPDSATLSYLIGAALELENLEKQRLLEIPDVEQRLGAEIALLTRNNALLEARLAERTRGGGITLV